MFTKKDRIKLFNALERIEDMYRNIFDILSEASNESLSVRDNEKQKEDLYCCCWKKDYSSSNTCPKCGLKKFY